MAKRLTVKKSDGTYSVISSIDETIKGTYRRIVKRLGEYEDLYPDIDVLRELSKCKGIYKED